MSLRYKISLILGIAFVLPLVLLGISAWSAMSRIGERAEEETVRTVLELEREHLTEVTRAKTLEIDQFLAVYQRDVSHLRISFEETHREFEEADGPPRHHVPEPYDSTVDTAGLPGFGYVHPDYGAYADFKGRGAGNPWVPRPVVEAVRKSASERSVIARDLHEVMTLTPLFGHVVERHRDTLDHVWVVLRSGVMQIVPTIEFEALLAQDPNLATIDEQSFDYVRLVGPARNPARHLRWVGPHLHAFKKVWVISCVAPLYDDNRFLGAVGADIQVRTVMENLLAVRSPGRGYAFLLGRDGRLLAVTPGGIDSVLAEGPARTAVRETMLPADQQQWTADLIGAMLKVTPRRDDGSSLRAVVNAMRSSESGLREVTAGGQQLLVSYAPVSRAGWSLGLVQPVEEVAASAASVRGIIAGGTSQTINDYLLLAFMVLVVSIIVGILVHRLTVHPLVSFSRAVENVRWDHLEFPEPDHKRRDEIGQLHAKFAEMIRLLRRARDELGQRQKLESIQVLAAGIAHDFNNLLGTILGNLSLARHRGHPGSDADRLLEQAEAATNRARGLTNQLLTFSTGGAPVLKPVRLPALLADAAGFAVRGTNVRCEFDIPPDLWPVLADEGQLTQVVQNLVLNAQQAMPSGGRVVIQARNLEVSGSELASLAPGRYVEVQVADEGEGIPPGIVSRIFDPFFTTKPGGSGLGLAVCFSVIQKHGGIINVSPRSGGGTIFRFHLPVAETATDEPTASPPHLVAGTGRILLMDDEASIREMVAEMLETLGYDVTTVADGAEAVTLYTRALTSPAPYEVVILDLTVPGGMGGREAVEALRSTDPNLCAIVSSGYSNDPILANYREYGFCAAIAKPYSFQDLAQTVARVVADHRARAGAGGQEPGA